MTVRSSTARARPAPDPEQSEPGLDAFLASVRDRRRENGQAEYITDPGVYNILDGLMAERVTASDDPQERAARRRRAVQRSRERVVYSD